MKKIILAALIFGAVLTSCSDNGKKAETTPAQDVKVVENNKTQKFKSILPGSSLEWRASHLGGVQPRFGKIFFKDATILVNNGKLTNAIVEMNMSTLTIESFPKGAAEIGKLKGHLTSPDFFNISKFPTSKFELSNINSSLGDYNSRVTGNLTIMGVTKSITFEANVNVSASEVSIKSEDFSIDRQDWGLNYNTEGDEGVSADYIISDDIGFTIDVKLSK